MGRREDLIEAVESLQNMFLARAESAAVDDREYRALRQQLVEEPEIADRLPRFVRTCRTLGQFWPYIKEIDGTYAGRRRHIWDGFRPVLDYLEGRGTPSDDAVSNSLQHLEEDDINAFWQRALERRSSDPEGAITAARTLVESTCKIILEDLGTPYPKNPDLPQLYHLVAEELNLGPQQHDEEIFKRILGGAKTVVDGLAVIAIEVVH